MCRTGTADKNGFLALKRKIDVVTRLTDENDVQFGFARDLMPMTLMIKTPTVIITFTKVDFYVIYHDCLRINPFNVNPIIQYR